jgi:hypothetical protein
MPATPAGAKPSSLPPLYATQLAHAGQASERTMTYPQAANPGGAEIHGGYMKAGGGADSVFAYCYARGDGTYTRLIPADMLPPLKEVPAVECNLTGMIVLPMPSAQPPVGPCSNTTPLELEVSRHNFRSI